MTAGPPEAEAGGVLIDRSRRAAENWRALTHRALPAECSAVIKADGYGCGIEPVAQALNRAGCKTFFVADLDEARRARTAAPEAALYVLNGLMPGSGPAFADINARPVIGSLLELAEWDAFVAANQWHGGAALHVDTGMNRLGVTANEAAALAPRIRAENHGITLLMSHLACAQMPEHPLNQRQISLFRDVRMLYRGIPSSLANSSGIFLGDAAYCDMVRPGVALYGVNPTPGRANPMRPVVGLKARILQVRRVPRGETVGYDATWTARHASRIAVVAAGYADGYPRAAGCGGFEAGRRRHHRRQALPAGRAHLHGPDGDRYLRPARQRRPARRDGNADRRRDQPRRGGQHRRHHRLRDVDPARAPVSPGLSGRMTAHVLVMFSFFR